VYISPLSIDFLDPPIVGLILPYVVPGHCWDIRLVAAYRASGCIDSEHMAYPV
jgi:hypothetical protein